MDEQILKQFQEIRKIALINVLKDANPIQKIWIKRIICCDIAINKIIFNDFNYDEFIKEHSCMLPKALEDARTEMNNN